MSENLDYSRIRGLMAGKNFTQIGFAGEVGIAQSYLSELVNNKKGASLPLLMRMAGALGMSGAQLLAVLERNIAVSEKTA